MARNPLSVARIRSSFPLIKLEQGSTSLSTDFVDAAFVPHRFAPENRADREAWFLRAALARPVRVSRSDNPAASDLAGAHP
jgi:hypothetical protein